MRRRNWGCRYLNMRCVCSIGEKPVRSGADLVAYWREAEVIGTRLDIEDSQAHARKLRNDAETRQWQEVG